MEIKDLKVDSQNPFFNAQKWNGSLEFSKNFEDIITGILGSKFKGIYKPQTKYNKDDYIWFNGKCYIITNVQNIGLKINQLEDTKNNYFYNDGSYCIKNNKITYIKGDNSKVINMTLVDSFAFIDSKDFFIAYKNNDSGSKIYKIPLSGRAEVINSNFTNQIKDIMIDDFYCYLLTVDNKISKFPLSGGTEDTYFEEINFSNTHDIVSMAVDNECIYVLNSNSDLIMIGKDGGTISTTSFRDYIVNPNLAKIAASDSFSLFLTDGDKGVHCFLIEKNSFTHSYSMDSKIRGIESINFSNKNITLTSESIVANMVSSEYQLEEVNIRGLISTISTLEISNAYLSVDFGRGQLVSNGETLIKPKGFDFNQSKTSLGIYSDTTNRVQFINYNGIQLHGNNLVYENIDFSNKTLIIEYFKGTPGAVIGNLPLGSKKANLIACTKTIASNFKTVYDVKESVIEATVITNEGQVEVFDIPIINTASSVFQLSANTNNVVSKILSVNKLDKFRLDYISKCSYIIPNHHMNSFLPYNSKNENGVIYVKTSNKSIISNDLGIKVNLSSNPEINDSEIAFNTEGAKALLVKINNIKSELEQNYSNKNHKHRFSELLDIPISNTNGTKGIVSLNGSVSSNSTTDAATPSAVKSSYDKAVNAERIANTKSDQAHKHNFNEILGIPYANVNGTKGLSSLNSSVSSNDENTAATPRAVKMSYDKAVSAENLAKTKLEARKGAVDGWYQRYTESVSGNLLDIFKKEKTGFFCGSSLQNGLPWGTHSWKHYISLSHANAAGYTGIIGLDFDASELGYTAISNGVLKPWARIWSSKNFNPDSKSDVHSHPYYSSNGGTINGNARINGTLDMSKVGNQSIIRFDAKANDPGYIMHYEDNNSSFMRFSVSDDRNQQDYFSWGSTPGGNYSQCAYMYTNGYFHTDGTIHTSGDIVAFSDRRLKENIEKIKDPLKLVEMLNGVIFDRIDTKIRQTGLIAQDVLQVLPEAVTMTDDGYYSVNYGSLIGLMVESIKELKNKIEILESSNR